MTWTRRAFLHTTAAAGAGLTLLPHPTLADFTHTKSDQHLRILVLGGTAFLGPAFV